MTKITLITGASAGIGEALARECARLGHNLLLVARRAERLEKLSFELIDSFGVQCSYFEQDLSLISAGERLYEFCYEQEFEVEFLINNAGFGSHGLFSNLDLDWELKMIDLNIRSLVELTHRFLPSMIEQGSGYILNNASVAGFQPGPGMNTYFSTKAFVLHFSEALRAELAETGVHCTCLCPGPTATEFGEVANYKSFNSLKPVSMSAKSVAKKAMKALLRNKAILIPGLQNKLVTQAHRFLPRNMLTKMLGKAILG